MLQLHFKALFLLLFAFCSSIKGQQVSLKNYYSLDSANAIHLKGDYITYNEVKMKLGPDAFFIDGRISSAEASNYPFVYSSIQDAVKDLTDGTESDPMTLYIAPYVYWLDNPNDTAIREGRQGMPPYALEIKCNWLRFLGLTPDAANVVLACNRGQTIGAKGNFTMLRINGEGTSSENITFGNYCNVDLEYSLLPELGKLKRASAIVQAQLIHCNGDKIVAKNTRFVSRLNLCPFVGAKRVFFDSCHFECTDDALCGTAVYYNSTFDFYSSKPFYSTVGTGVVFLNCDIRSFTRGKQHFTKAMGQVVLVDTRINSSTVNYLSWQDIQPSVMRNYQCNVQLNGQPVFVGNKQKLNTVDMNDKPLLNAYLFKHENKNIYNIYNLLKGNDEWDPANMKNMVECAARSTKSQLSDIPVQLRLKVDRTIIETGIDTLRIEAKQFRFGNYSSKIDSLKWSIHGYEALASLQTLGSAELCLLIPANEQDTPQKVIVMAETSSGLQAACEIEVLPRQLSAPEFLNEPEIKFVDNGNLRVDYILNTDYTDQSEVSWFRCNDDNGGEAIKVAVSFNNEPLKNYELSCDDVGYYIMAEVAPKHIRSVAGESHNRIFSSVITGEHVKTNKNRLYTNFKNVALDNQFKVLPGFWTFMPNEAKQNDKVIPIDSSKNAWYYGAGSSGSADLHGLLQSGRSATMFYTPLTGKGNNMTLKMEVSPFKTAGQGFSMAHLYMDVVIQFDAKLKCGYGIRFIRTTKYGNAVDCFFVEYKNGKATPITEAITTSCYRTPCFIEVAVCNEMLSAKAHTTSNYYKDSNQTAVLSEVKVETKIKPHKANGFGIIYNGGASTMINKIEIDWEYYGEPPP